MNTFFTIIPSPLGPLTLVSRGPRDSRDGGLAHVFMENQTHAPKRDATWLEDPARFDEPRAQLEEYFAGTRTRFELVLAPEGTPFQQRVWAALAAIPFGETLSYGELARRLGLAGGARAVGHANARNPHAIVVPCHRVLGADGSLTGYAGGASRKRWLLDWESAQADGRYRSTMSVSSSATSRVRSVSSSASTAA
jgi:methylated-DNA-[protein]-cysteine S-methyltransferase